MISNIDTWNKINSYELDDSNSSMKFSQRLMRENLNWSYEYSLRVLEEYKRFIYLSCVTKLPVTPSDEIDQAWHLHLLYTRSYDEMCKLINKKINHGPTKGGEEENEKFKYLYKETLNLYESEFEIKPPIDIWPSLEERFYPYDFKRVCLNKHWIIPVGDYKALINLLIRRFL